MNGQQYLIFTKERNDGMQWSNISGDGGAQMVIMRNDVLAIADNKEAAKPMILLLKIAFPFDKVTTESLDVELSLDLFTPRTLTALLKKVAEIKKSELEI